MFRFLVGIISAFVLTLVEAGKSIRTIHCNFYIYVGRTQWWIPPKPSEWKKLCKDNVKPCQHCVPSPTLKIIVPPDSSGSTVPQIAGYDLEQSHSPTNRNGLQQLFSNEQNQGFPRTQKRHTLRCALLGLDRPVMEFGQEVSVDQRTAWSGRFPCTQVTPSEKS